MPGYRLFHFKDDHIVHTQELTAWDDLEAIDKAVQLQDGLLAELWRGARRVKTFQSRQH